MQLRHYASPGRPWRSCLYLTVAVGGMTAVLFAAVHHALSAAVLLAGICGALAAWASYVTIRALIGARLAHTVTLWLMLALVVLALAPVAIFQLYAAVCVVMIWTMCIAFQDVLR